MYMQSAVVRHMGQFHCGMSETDCNPPRATSSCSDTVRQRSNIDDLSTYIYIYVCLCGGGGLCRVISVADRLRWVTEVRQQASNQLDSME